MAQDCLELRDELRRRVDRGIRGFEGWYRAEKGERYLQAEEGAVLRALHLRPGSTLIDAGCGGGRFTLLLAPRCLWVRAVDLSAVAVETTAGRARDRGLGNVSTAVADIASGIPGEPAERVLSVQTIQHLPGRELRLAAAKSLCRALVPGGRLVVTVFNGGRLMDRLRGRSRELTDPAQGWLYYRRFLVGELRSLLEAAGLAGVEVRSAVNLPGRLYRRSWARWLLPLDRALETRPPGRALGIYLVGAGWRP